MPLYEIAGPDGKVYEIEGPAGATREQVIAAIQSRLAAQPKSQEPKKAEDVGIIEGAGTALKRGFESFGDIASGYGLAGSSLFGTEAGTQRRMEAIKREQEKEAQEAAKAPMMTVADFERIAAEKGVLEAAKEAPKYILEQLGLSGPQMAVPLAVGAGASAVAGPLVGAVAGMGAYGLQQFGNFLARQAVEKKDAKELSVLDAAISAGGTAPIGYFADRFTVGLGSVGKNAGKEIAKELSARQIAMQTGKRAVGGAAAGIIAEAPTEVLESAAERWQAGLSLTDKDAYDEYKESFFGAAAIGGGIGGTAAGYRGYKEATAAPAAPTPPEAVTPPTPPALSDAFQMTPVDRARELSTLLQGEQTPDVQARIDELRAADIQQVEQDLARIKLPVEEKGGKKRKETDEEFFARTEPTTLEEQIKTQAPTQMAIREAGVEETGFIPGAEFAGPTPEAQFPTVLTSDVLDRTGLSKRSSFYKELEGKDLTDPKDQAAVGEILKRVRANPNLSESTKSGVENVAMQGFGAAATQREMFGKRRVKGELPVTAEAMRTGAVEPTQAELFEEEKPVPEGRPVTEADLKSMGIGPTNKKIREEILGKDLNDPEQAQTVKEVLDAFGSDPKRSPKVAKGVEDFLAEMGFRKAEDGRTTKPVTRAVKPSVPVSEQRRVEPTEGVGAPVVEGLGSVGPDVTAPPVGEEGKQPTLKKAVWKSKDYDFPVEVVDEPAMVGSDGVSYSKVIFNGQETFVPTNQLDISAEAGVTTTPTKKETKEVTPRQKTVDEANANFGEYVKDTGSVEAALDRMAGEIAFETKLNRVNKSAQKALSPELQQKLQDKVKQYRFKAKQGEKAAQRYLKYRTAPAGMKGNPKKAVEANVRTLMKGWVNAPKTEVVQSITELPDYMQAEIREAKVNPKGAFDPRTETVYIVSDNIAGYRDLTVTVAHEAIGHYGLRSVLGNTYSKVLNDLYRTNDQVRAKADIKIKEGLDKETAIEEVMAEAIEEKVPADTMMGKAVEMLRNIIRRIMRAFGVSTLNNREVQDLLDSFAGYVVEGKGTRGEGVARPKAGIFRGEEVTPRNTESKEFKRWFGNSKILNDMDTGPVSGEDVMNFLKIPQNEQRNYWGNLSPDERDSLINDYRNRKKLGAPKIMYHGTARDFTEFRPKQANAIFLTDSPRFAEDFTGMSENYMADEFFKSLEESEKSIYRKRAEKISKRNGTNYADELLEIIKEQLPSRANIMPVYVRAENPFDYENPRHIEQVLANYPKKYRMADGSVNPDDIVQFRNGAWDVIEDSDIQNVIRSLGFDAFYVKEGGRKNLAVYDPNQIKSAIGNIGTYSLTSPNILFRGEELEIMKGDAAWSPKRIDTLLSTWAYRNDVNDTKAYAGFVDPQDFLDATTTKDYKEVLEGEKRPLEQEKLAGEIQPIFLLMKPDFQYGFASIIGHEGRHRMMALRDAGVTKVPVVFVNGYSGQRMQNAEPQDFVKMYQEQFGTEKAISGFTVENLVPISYAYRDQLKQTFGQPSAQVVFRRGAAPTLTAEGQKAQQVVDRMKGISNEKPKVPEKSTIEKVGAFFFDPSYRQDQIDRFRTQVAYKGASVERKLMDAFNGKVRDALGNIRPDLFMTAAEHSDTMTVAAMKQGTLYLNKNIGWDVKKGPNTLQGAMDTVRKLGEKLGSQDLAFKLANDAFIARRANALKNHPNKDVFALPSQDKIDAGMQAFRDFPELEKAFQEYTGFKNGQIDAMVEGGRLSPEQAKTWKDAIDYVPWNRIKEYEETAQTSPKGYFKGLTNLGQMGKLTGSENEINNVFDNMVGLSFWMTNSAIRNHAALNLVDTFNRLNLGIRPVREGQSGVDPNKVIYIYRDGKPESYELDSIADVYAFKGVESMSMPMLKSLSSFANFLRKATTATPQFAVSQLFQDSYRATVMSGTKSPFRVAAGVLGGFKNAYFGDPTTQRLEQLGIVGMYDLMPGRVKEDIEKEFGLKQRGTMEKAINFMESFSIASDAALRKSVFERTLAETKSEQFPEGDVLLARYRAQEIINFKRQGANRMVGLFRQVIPFMNAYIQGMDVFYRSMTGRGIAADERAAATKLFWATGAKLAALSALYAFMVGDDDEYQGLRDFEKDKNFIIPGLPFPNKIPVAPEVGFLFKVLPERAYNYIVSQGTESPQDATALRKAIATAGFDAITGPNLTPQFVKPLIEAGLNYSFFTNTPIVGRGLEQREASQQFTANTSELAKMFGELTGMSPMKMEYIFRGYTGIAGGTLLDMTNMMFTNRADRHVYELPGFKTFMYDKIPGGYKEQYYDLRDRVTEVNATINGMIADGRVDELMPYLTDEKLNKYALMQTVNEIDQTLEDFRAMRKLVAGDKSMSGEEKRRIIDDIEQTENEMLKFYNIPAMRKKIAGL